MSARIAAAMSIVGLLLSPATGFGQTWPDHYPAEYGDLVDGSRSEGDLLVYSNMSPENWAPVISGFAALYPWISVETLDIGSGEVFSRFEAEAASGVHTADVLVSVSPDRWIDVAADGLLADYDSPERAFLPDFASAPGGVYTISTDPLVLVYNRQLLSEDQWPTGLESLVRIATADPDGFRNRVASYEATDGAFSLTVWRATMFEAGDAGWRHLSTLAPLLRVDTGSTSSIVEKTAAGEYLVSYLLSGISFFPRLRDPGGELLGFAFPDDGTPLVFRGIAVTRDAPNPNAARLFLDYVLSRDGQVAVGEGGLTPYRSDVPADAVPFYTYHAIAEAVGDDNLILATYDADHIAYTDAFLTAWQTTVTDIER